MEGWIKIWRKFLTWEWYDDNPVKVLFIHLLLTANYEDKKWKGILVKRGQVITSLSNLSKSTGLSIKCVRVSLEKLKTTNEVAIKGANTYSILTICNYDTYQDKEDTQGQAQGQAEGHAKGHAKGKQRARQRATTKEDKKERIKEGKNINNPSLLFVSSEFLPVWNKWLTYRKEVKKPYRTETGMITKYNELVTLSGNNAASALLIVDQSIGNEWSGFFPLKRNGHAALPGEDDFTKMMRETTEELKKANML